MFCTPIPVNVAKKLIVDTGSDNLIAEFKSSGDSIGEIRIADSSKYTRLLTVGDTFKIMPSDGDEVFNVSDSAISVLTPLTVGVDDTGHDVIFYGATSGRYLQWDESDDSLKFRDNVKAKFGDGNDLALHHSGSQSEIKNLTGNLIIENTADDADIIFKLPTTFILQACMGSLSIISICFIAAACITISGLTLSKIL